MCIPPEVLAEDCDGKSKYNKNERSRENRNKPANSCSNTRTNMNSSCNQTAWNLQHTHAANGFVTKVTFIFVFRYAGRPWTCVPRVTGFPACSSKNPNSVG